MNSLQLIIIISNDENRDWLDLTSRKCRVSRVATKDIIEVLNRRHFELCAKQYDPLNLRRCKIWTDNEELIDFML